MKCGIFYLSLNPIDKERRQLIVLSGGRSCWVRVEEIDVDTSDPRHDYGLRQANPRMGEMVMTIPLETE